MPSYSASLGKVTGAGPLKLLKRAVPGRTRNSLAQGVFSTISDFYVLAIPWHMAWGLNLPLRRKFGVSAIFFNWSSVSRGAFRREVQSVHINRAAAL